MKRIYLKRARDKKGLTQEQLEAETTRRGRTVTQAQISRLERHVPERIDFDIVVALADALDVDDPRQLAFGPDPKEREALAS